MAGSQVKLNEIIEGREFDVSIRFKNGLHMFHTLIECKNYGSPVSVEKIDAFATKSRDAGASKALMFSKNGFQSGAKTVAKRHRIDLYSLKESVEIPKSVRSGNEQDVLNFTEIGLILEDETVFLPDAHGRLEYCMKHSNLKDGDNETNLHDFVDSYWDHLEEPKLDQIKEKSFRVPEGTTIAVKGFLETSLLKRVVVRYQLVEGIGVNIPMDAHLMEKLHLQYFLVNEISGEEESIAAIDVHLGFDKEVFAGNFYANSNIGNNYFIESIENGIMKVYLVESYSRGHLFQAVMTAETKYQDQYVLITDSLEIERLKKLYDKMKKHETSRQ